MARKLDGTYIQSGTITTTQLASTANSAANTVRVSANSGSTLTGKQLNFINTSTITVTVSDAADGNANVALTAVGGAAYDQANNAYAAANSIANGETSITLKSYREALITNNTVNSANTINLASANWFRYTLTGNTTLTFANAPASGNAFLFSVYVSQDSTGGRTITWANTIYWAGALTPPATTSANARDVWSFTTFDGGSTFLGTLTIKDAR